MRSIFVFGANCAGRHGKGAAKYAALKCGAEYGIGEGPTGWAYAIPTKDERLRVRSIEEIQGSVENFLKYTQSMPELKFKVSRIGCGLAGFTDAQIAPLFLGAPENCGFDSAWTPWGLKTWRDAGITD